MRTDIRSFIAKVLSVDPRVGTVTLSTPSRKVEDWKLRRAEWEIQRLCPGLTYMFSSEDSGGTTTGGITRRLRAWAPEPPDRKQITRFIELCGGKPTMTRGITGEALLADAGAALKRKGAPQEVVQAAERWLPAGWAALSMACLEAGARQAETEELLSALIERECPPQDYVAWLSVHGFSLALEGDLTAKFEVFDRLVTAGNSSTDRIEAAAVRALVINERNGHTWMRYGVLQHRVSSDTGANSDEVHKVLFEARKENFRFLKEDVDDGRGGTKSVFFVTRRQIAVYENICVNGFYAQVQRPLVSRLALNGEAKQLSDDQLAAAEHIASHPLTVLVGPAGSGKTTVAKAIAKSIVADDKSVALTATTGQAAKVLDAKTGTTLHSFLRATPGKERGYQTAQVDLLVVDECSMMDTSLSSPLGSYMGNGLAERVVLVGDQYQIPPVGAGAVLRDIIESREIAPFVVRLDKVRRVKRGKRSEILALANALRAGQPLPDLAGSEEIEVVPIGDDYVQTANAIAEMVVGEDDWMILSAMYNSPLGVYQLGQRVRDRVLGKSTDPWMPGERIVQRRNWRTDPDDRDSPVIPNGTFGVIDKVGSDGSLSVVYDDGTHAQIDARKAAHGRGLIEPAFALTVHRAQGGQAKTVIVVVDPAGASMWKDRSIGYTAVTRARERLVIVGDPSILRGQDGERAMDKRQTGLPSRLRRKFQDGNQPSSQGRSQMRKGGRK